MAAKGYTNAARIADYLGRTLTNAQYAQAAALVEPVEALIDRRTQRAWMGVSPITDEQHQLYDGDVWLDNRPVTAITTVKVRYNPLETDTTLAAADNWVLLNAVSGQMWISPAYYGYVARVTYTHGGPAIPADLGLAATKLAAHWLQPSLDGVGPDIQEYSVGAELSVVYADGRDADVPENIRKVIDGYRSLSKVFA